MTPQDIEELAQDLQVEAEVMLWNNGAFGRAYYDNQVMGYVLEDQKRGTIIPISGASDSELTAARAIAARDWEPIGSIPVDALKVANLTRPETIRISDVREVVDRMRARTHRIVAVFSGSSDYFDVDTLAIVEERNGFFVAHIGDTERPQASLEAIAVDMLGLGFELVR